MASGSGDNVAINLICSGDGVVLFQTPTRAPAGAENRGDSGDDWRSGEGAVTTFDAIGKPLVKTFWFDHLDCDHKELQQIVRRAGNGKPDRVRVWLRIDEHQLIRAELTATPLHDAAGKAKQVLIRTEPTRPAPRRRDSAAGAEPNEKRVRVAEETPAEPTAPPPDLLTMRLGAPMLRVELAGGTIIAANDAVANLLGRSAAECVSLPLTEVIDAADRKPIVEALAAARATGTIDRAFDLTLRRNGGDGVPAHLTLLADPRSTSDKPTILATAQDRSLERRATELATQVEQLSERLTVATESGRRLERLFERSPFGLALFENAQPVRTNAAFDAQTAESAGWVDALAHRALKSKAVAEQHSTRQSIASFWLGDEADGNGKATPALVGAVVTPAPREAVGFEQRLDAILRAMGLGGRLAMLIIEPGGELRPQGTARETLSLPADDAPLTPEQLFDADSLGEYRSIVAQARSSKAAVTTRLTLSDHRSPCYATFSPLNDGGGAMLLLIEDYREAAEQIDAARDRVHAAQQELNQLRASRIDPAEMERLRRQLADRKEQVRTLLAATESGAFSWDLIDGTITADERTCELLGCDAAADEGLSPTRLFAAADASERTAFERQLFDAMSPEGSGRVDLRMHVGPARDPVRIVGNVVFDEAHDLTASDETPDPTRLVAAVIDLRGEKRAQEVLHGVESKRDELAGLLKLRTAELNAIFECAPDAIRIRSNGMMRHNAAAANLFGDHLETMFGRNGSASDRFAVKLLEGADLPVGRALGGEIGSGVVELKRDGESPRIVQSNAAPIVLDGDVVGAVSIEADLTEQRALEAALRDREEQIAGFFQNTGVGVAYLDPAGKILDANPQLSALLGTGRAELVGRAMQTLSASDDRAILSGQIEAVLSGELTSCSSEIRLTHRDGATFWTQLTIAPRHAADGDRSVVALIQDIDELRRLRERVGDATTQLETIAERYELISTTIAEGFLIVDLAGRVVEANDAARKLLGLREVGAGDNAFDHLQFESPETGTTVLDRFPWQRALRGKATTADYRVRRRVNGVVDTTKSTVLQFAASPGPRSTAIVNVRDITTRHGLHEDLQQAYARIVEAHTMMQQRTKALEGNFVSAVRQLSAAVGASAPIARAMLADNKLAMESRNAVRQLVDALRVHDRLVQHFVADTAADAATATAPVRSVTDMNALLDEASRLVTERFHAAAGRIEPSLAATRANCRVDGALVRHAFWSVLAHAASQASKEHAQLATVDARAEGEDNAARLRITVTWPGTRANTAELTLARALIESERGTFALATADGHTTATIEFAPADEPLAPTAPAAANARTMRVVLVEDHDSTARVLTRQLTRLRCDVTLARTLAEARAAIDGKSTIDLVVCDLTMPDGNALDFVRRATTKAKIPTIGLRSYGGPLPRDASGEGEEAALAKQVGNLFEQLVKPVDLNALAAAITRITGRTASATSAS